MNVGLSDEAVRQQLGRLLESDMFKASKRCRTFLSFVVTQRLAGQAESLREKVIGVEAFGRTSGYDTTEDPVVRITAGEVRKRLAQYYQDPERAGEPRVELVAGSYVPEFHLPVVAAGEVTVTGREWRWRWVLGALVLVGLVYGVWRYGPGGTTAFERFWAPTLGAHGPVLVSVGQSRVYSLRKKVANAAESDLDPEHSGVPARGLSSGFALSSRDVIPSWDRYAPMGDAMSMTALAVFFHDRHKDYRLRGSGTTTLADLREGAAVLIGAFSNDWTLRTNKDLRFRVVLGADGWRSIEDGQEVGSSKWRGSFIDTPLEAEAVDYAVLTRVFDETTGRPVISVGGITHLGTKAGGEFLLSEVSMNEGLRGAPAGWEKKNLQMVVSTKVIGASASPPRFVALHVW